MTRGHTPKELIMKHFFTTGLARIATALAGMAITATALAATALPSPAIDTPLASKSTTETAVLAGGCFWGIEAVFEHLKGVTQATSGYSGGSAESAKYEKVSSGS